MKPGSPHAAIEAFVTSVRCRLRLRRGVARLLWGACLGLVAAAAALVIGRWTGMSPAWSRLAPPIAAAFSGLAFVAAPWRRTPSKEAAVKLADGRLGLRDQLVNAVEFIRGRHEGLLAELTIEQTTGRIRSAGAPRKVVPWRLPAAAWALIAAAAGCWYAQRALYATQERRQIEVTADLGASLLTYAAGAAEADEKQFQASLALMTELQMLNAKAGKEEILARLSRMIQDADSSQDEAMKKQLDGLKKLREQFALGELRREMQEELDKGHEELAVTDEQGVKVKAEAIQTLALVEKREKQAELAREVKEVARQMRDQAQEEKKKASEWAVAPETPAAGEKKQVKQAVASYKDIERLAQNRDILRMILSAAADRGRAGEEYHEVYENYRRMMRTFLFTQGLPSGEAEYVERYFKAIKPRETRTAR